MWPWAGLGKLAVYVYLIVVSLAARGKRRTGKRESIFSDIRRIGVGTAVVALLGVLAMLVGGIGAELVGSRVTTPGEMAIRYLPYYLVMLAGLIPAVIVRLSQADAKSEWPRD